mgnify:CR=1 FL=1
MEKLIELLNKHRREKVNKQSWITEWHYNAFTFSLDNISWQQAELLIISKQYWFIKWLVENKKIDREKFWNSETKSSKYSDFELSYDTPREDYTNTLLMELAIQNEPIQFLIEMLK